MFTKLIVSFISALCLIQVTYSARILFLLPAPSLSHHLFYRPIIRELSLRGHDVVSISPDPMNDPTLTNLTEIDIHEETYGSVSVEKWLEGCKTKPESEMTKLRNIKPHFLLSYEMVLSSSQVRQLLENKTEHFDLFVLEMLGNPYFLGFKEHFKCPAIGLASLDSNLVGMDAIGNPPDPNYYASLFEKTSGPNLSFWERLSLVWHNIDFRIFYYIEMAPKMNRLLEKYFNITDKTAIELENSIDLVMVNTNPIFHIPKPHVPVLIEIGGLHQRERKPLPKDLQTYMDNSKAGVVYFSLGSNVKSQNLPVHVRKNIIQAFERLPYNVIWKWENESLADKPENVLIKKWLPQQDVLDHPNLKAFITQGGLQSLEEAIGSRVPIIGIPFGVDQEFNIERIVALGVGRRMDFRKITMESFLEVLNDVASNPKYKDSVTKVGSYIWDQHTKPLDRAIWWIEYVIRHGGARHLRCPAADLPWYKYLLLDIVGFVLGVLFVIVYLVVFSVKFILRQFFYGKSKFKKE